MEISMNVNMKMELNKEKELSSFLMEILIMEISKMIKEMV